MARIARPVKPDEKHSVEERYRKFLHHQVVTTDEVMQILDLSSIETEEHERSVVRLPCICRYASLGKEKQLHCFGIAFTDLYTKRFPDYLGGKHEYMATADAAEIMKNMSEEEDVVHAVSALGVPYIGMICNCDMNVCRPYIHRMRLGISEPFHKGHYVTVVDEQKCVGCGTCENVCAFGAISVDPENNVARVNVDECYGCGVCSKRCPEYALDSEKNLRVSDF
jgi:NAD-dependent dihydropyrimidine dehydrogenase PreA subunit